MSKKRKRKTSKMSEDDLREEFNSRTFEAIRKAFTPSEPPSNVPPEDELDSLQVGIGKLAKDIQSRIDREWFKAESSAFWMIKKHKRKKRIKTKKQHADKVRVEESKKQKEKIRDYLNKHPGASANRVKRGLSLTIGERQVSRYIREIKEGK